jgi:hypothetical protein
MQVQLRAGWHVRHPGANEMAPFGGTFQAVHICNLAVAGKLVRAAAVGACSSVVASLLPPPEQVC